MNSAAHSSKQKTNVTPRPLIRALSLRSLGLCLMVIILLILCACGGDSGSVSASAGENDIGAQSDSNGESTSEDHDPDPLEQQEQTVIMTVYDGEENVLFWHETIYDGSVIHDGMLSLTNWVSVTSYDRDGTETGHAEHIWDEQGNERSWYSSVGWHGGGNANSFTYFDGIGTVSQLTTTAEYNSAGEMVSSTTYNSDGGISGYSEYEHNDAGQNVRSVFYSESGESTGMLINEYDNAGNMTCRKRYDGNGGLLLCELYEYDSAGRQIATEYYSSEGVLEDRHETEYDENGHRCRSTDYSGGSVSSYTTYEYSESGKCISKNEYRDEHDDGHFLNTSRVVFIYGQNEELLSVEYYDLHYEAHYDLYYETYGGVITGAYYDNPTYDEPPEETFLGKEVYVYI